MNPSLALLVCSLGIAGLFYLDRDKSLRPSKAIWLPIIWIAIVGSRSASDWLGLAPVSSDPNQLIDGSPFDRVVFEILLGLGIIVLILRGNRLRAFLAGIWPILLYFFYCLLSVIWSDFPDVSFKRWIKSIGDLVMVLIIVTDAHPADAFKRLISRLGFVLMPASILLIKYFGNLGRGYDPNGQPMNTGVTSTKNSLGVITLVITLGVLWQILTLRRDKDLPDRRRHMVAQATLLAFGVAVLVLAHSATSGACFALGAGLIFATSLPVMRRRPAGVHALVLALFLMGGLAMFLNAEAEVVHALGRETTLTGRTEIWAAVIPVVPNPIVGAGFESFWLGPRLDRVWGQLSQYMHVNEAHNGYLEVYLNLGWVGVGLIALILIKGYRNVVAAFRNDPATGSLWLAYFFAAVFYSVTEAGFRLLSPIWIFLLLAIVAAGGTASAVRRRAAEPPGAPADLSSTLPSADSFRPRLLGGTN